MPAAKGEKVYRRYTDVPCDLAAIEQWQQQNGIAMYFHLEKGASYTCTGETIVVNPKLFRAMVRAIKVIIPRPATKKPKKKGR